ncbi:MAG: trypsin-like peptidase domain-containing protein [Eubacteriales bacterium]|nr:trypsin-like peptidase domain-containing protein [Eubacteriales bacterium]
MKNRDNKNEQVRKIAKKGLTISLCAALAGGVAAGAFEGVNRLNGWNQPSTVEAAVNNGTELTLTKSESKSDDEDKSETTVKGSLDVSDIVEEAMPSVVSITTKTVQEIQDYYGFFQYGGYGYAPQQQEQEVEGSGSGIIIGKNDDYLLIATNYHVVEDADTLSVSFIDGNACEATVRGFDEDKDLAVVSVPLDDISDDTMDAISIASIGNSDDLKVGEQVVAIGNALGYGQSVTTGIVSAKNRRLDGSVLSEEDLEEDDGVNLIQTDAAINPGNSGGALLNMDGEVVGINSAKLASTEVEGMGYAIAITDVADILENLMNEEPREKLEDADHGILGIQGRSVSDDVTEAYGIPEGVFVVEVTEGGAAEDAGIKKNSVITYFDGKRVRTIEDLVDLLTYYEPGEEIEVTMEVMDGEGYKEATATVTLGENTNADEQEDKRDDSKDDGKDENKDDRQDDGSSEDNSDADEEEDSDNLFDDWENSEEGRDIREFFEQWQ